MHDLITTAFEVIGLLLIAAAAGVALATYLGLAAGLGGAGAALILESVIVDALAPKPRPTEGDVA